MQLQPSLEMRGSTAVPNREELTREKEKSREAAQIKTYTRWVNAHLRVHTPPLHVTDLVQDFRNGVALINLLHQLYRIPLPFYHMQPTSKIHALDNMVVAFQMLEQATGTGFPFVKPANVVDGDTKIIMGLIWALVLDSGVRKPLDLEAQKTDCTQSFEKTSNAVLLRWCQQKTKNYKGVNIQNFTDSFADGLAFNALLHNYDPSLVNYDLLDPTAQADNLRTAFSIAELKLGIPQLLDVTDFDGKYPTDEHSVITYVSEFVKLFAQEASPAAISLSDPLVTVQSGSPPPLPPRSSQPPLLPTQSHQYQKQHQNQHDHQKQQKPSVSGQRRAPKRAGAGARLVEKAYLW